MNKFHSTVNRRDFMKGLGLAGAGIGAAAAAAPVFHDLDEAAASPQSALKRPWYISENDFGNATVPIDWGIVRRRDQSLSFLKFRRKPASMLSCGRSTLPSFTAMPASIRRVLLMTM